MSQNFCPCCGHHVNKDAQYCPYCGHKLTNSGGTYLYTKYGDPDLQRKKEDYFKLVIQQEAKRKYHLYFIMTSIIFIIVMLMTIIGILYFVIHS